MTCVSSLVFCARQLPFSPVPPSRRREFASSRPQTSRRVWADEEAQALPCRLPLRWRRSQRRAITNQALVRHAPSHDSPQDFDKPLGVCRLARVEPEGFLVQVSEQVKRLDADVRALDRPLEQGPEVFEPIGVDVPAHVSLRVVDDFVLVLGEPVVRREGISIERGARLDVLAHFGAERPLAGIGDDLNSHAAVPVWTMALQESDDRRLVHWAGALDFRGALPRVHEARLPADESLVHFDFPAQLAEPAALHGEPNAVHHEPRALLGDSEGAPHFVGTDPVLVVDDHPHGGQPLVQPERGILEDRADLDGELAALVILPALPAPLIGQKDDFAATTRRTRHTVWPAEIGEEVQAHVRIGEVADGFDQGLGGSDCLVHALRVAGRAGLVKYIVAQISGRGRIAPIRGVTLS